MGENTHVKEAQHYYWPDGRPAYEVPSSDGKRMIEPDIRHARKLGLVPGVSTIINCAAKPALENWKIDQALLSALTLPRINGESDDEFMKRAKLDSKEQSIKAAEKGTEIHSAIQAYYDNRKFETTFPVECVGEAIYNTWGSLHWKPEVSFAHPMGYGGKLDLYHPGVIIDFKGKDFDELPSKSNGIQLAWDENCIQLAAYRAGQDDGTADCANVYFSRTKPGLVYIHQWSEDDLKRGWKMFKALLEYWKAKNRYQS